MSCLDRSSQDWSGQDLQSGQVKLLEVRSRIGQGKINVRLRQSNHNHNHKYNLKGFDTIEINLVISIYDVVKGNLAMMVDNDSYFVSGEMNKIKRILT